MPITSVRDRGHIAEMRSVGILAEWSEDVSRALCGMTQVIAPKRARVRVSPVPRPGARRYLFAFQGVRLVLETDTQ